MRRLPVLMLLVYALAVPASASASTPGVNVPMSADPGLWRLIGPTHAKTVRAFVNWRSTDPYWMGVYAAFVRHARAHHVKVELAVTGGPGNMATPAQYAAAVGAIARRLKGRVMGYEIWNEPDSGFWEGGPNPGAYATLLKAAHRSLRRADRRARVVVGGLVASDYDFLAALYRHGAKGSFDAVAVHTDTACNTTDPKAYYREPSGRIGRYAFTGYRELHKLMRRHGDGRKPIWMTELGWSTSTRPCPVAAKAGGVSRATQARFLTRAYRCLERDRYVTQGMWFTLIDPDSAGADPSGQFGLVDGGLSAKPALAAFRRARRATGMRCGGALDGRRPSVHFVRPRSGTRYVRSLPVRVTADDDHGVKDINLFLDGHYVPLKTKVHGRRASIATMLWRAGKLGYGRHTLVAKARDEARNWGTTRLTIVHVAR